MHKHFYQHHRTVHDNLHVQVSIEFDGLFCISSSLNSNKTPLTRNESSSPKPAEKHWKLMQHGSNILDGMSLNFSGNIQSFAPRKNRKFAGRHQTNSEMSHWKYCFHISLI
jgi:hypothetical protein